MKAIYFPSLTSGGSRACDSDNAVRFLSDGTVAGEDHGSRSVTRDRRII
jgi:hypothetical protein